ncbi:MAG: 1-deoxy-D-xylulose-5-phosphate synthase [Chloroflexi bacterium]|nr:1-deoxy-D-xylulose-5-phosphate synthase [Chloroflexota bacterium]
MPRTLDSINSPQDLKKLAREQLPQLAREIREELVSIVTGTGGHLASNLGVVELTLALHRVFDSPRDKILWDVGHQSYVHKLITGRRERFDTLRQYEGLSGFTDRRESVHDPFTAGHASTSISAALGMATARDMAGENNHVIAVIGDGAITGGMALEAVNQAGHRGTRLLVILNDNGMSISPNVGALARLMNRLSVDRRYHRAKTGAREVVSKLPLGARMWRLAEWMKVSLGGTVLPRAFWSQLGFTYVGPIDGHDEAELERVLALVRETYHRPTMVHVITTKGKGYEPAEDDCITFHGVPPRGHSHSEHPTYSQVFGRTLARLFHDDPRLVAVTAAMPGGTGLSQVAREFPARVFDVGICEQHGVTFAAGLASQGYIPVVAIYSTFLQRAVDQVIHDVCIQNVPVVFALDRSGIVGDDGQTHQGSFDLSYLLPIPNLVVSAPKDENELQHLLLTATRCSRPMAIRYPRGFGTGAPLDPQPKELPIGKGELLRSGKDVAIVAIGAMVPAAVEAADILDGQGISATVVNARFAKPLDSELILEAAHAARRVVTVEENALAGGFGSAVLQLLRSAWLHNVSVASMGLPDEFVAQGPPELLRAQYGLDANGIARQVLDSFPELVARQTSGSEPRRARG